jgi:hypothetical protein
MNIEMLSHKTLKEIDEEFHKRFPYLKLAFFSKPHTEGELSSNEDAVDLNQTLGEFGSSIVDWKVDGLTVVGELEKKFQENTGLSVQVMRKSGELWLQTSRTDHLTLAEQNAKGRGKDEPLSGSEEPGDYHEQE